MSHSNNRSTEENNLASENSGNPSDKGNTFTTDYSDEENSWTTDDDENLPDGENTWNTFL